MDMTTQLSAMVATLFTIAVGLAPFAAIFGMLRLVDRIGQRREARYARQIELTDAIHRELGAIVAPIVRRGRDLSKPVATGRIPPTLYAATS